MKLKILLFAVAVLLIPSAASAQSCSGQPASGLICGNPTASQGLPTWATQTALTDRNYGSTPGTIPNRGASVWSAVATPTFGQNGGTGGSLSLKGATSGTATIGVNPVAGTATFNLPTSNGSSGFVLSTDGSGNTSWVNNAAGGTVQSVGLSLPSIFTVTGSPVTATGTLTGTLNTQAANQLWSGPASGAAASPSFRALVGADLPNPSATTLGGIQSYAAVPNQWISAISTLGVPISTQPAFTNISGTLAPSQCPTPTSGTIGCVQSLTAATSKWINSISTLGVPSATQPTFSDISGSAMLSQIATLSNNTILGNISGSTASPSALQPSAVLDAVFGNAQGNVLYRNGTNWTVLAPGTAGQILSTGGPSANPSWIAAAGGGTVTSVATGTGLTGGTITSSGTISLASAANNTVLANTSGVSAAPIPTTVSTVLDAIGSTQGNILYRGASTWAALAPGTTGQVLQTQGAGSTPQWAGGAANPTATAGPAAINGTATTYMRSDGAPAIQLGTNAVKGLVQGDATTINCVAGVCNQVNGAYSQVIGASRGVTSTTALMGGFGGICTITPTKTGRVNFFIQGTVQNSSASNTNNGWALRYGTGTAPASGAAVTGTAIISGNTYLTQPQTTSMFSSGAVTGLALGTAIWFDVSMSSGSGTFTLANANCTAIEF